MEKFSSNRAIFIVTCILFFLPQAIGAQSLKKQKATMGMGGTSSNISINNKLYYLQQSVGQFGTVGTIRTNNIIMIQGFIQPIFNSDGVQESTDLDVDIRLVPFSDSYVISINDLWIEKMDVHLYSINGKQLYYRMFKNTGEFTIDLSSFASGYYLLFIISNERKYSTKLIKN